MAPSNFDSFLWKERKVYSNGYMKPFPTLSFVKKGKFKKILESCTQDGRGIFFDTIL